MTFSDKLFVSRLSFIVVVAIVLLMGYATYISYAGEIQDEIAKTLNDSFGHLKGELAQL